MCLNGAGPLTLIYFFTANTAYGYYTDNGLVESMGAEYPRIQKANYKLYTEKGPYSSSTGTQASSALSLKLFIL